jgi:hypothetical protein
MGMAHVVEDLLLLSSVSVSVGTYHYSAKPLPIPTTI